jgi:hypothetical protein
MKRTAKKVSKAPLKRPSQLLRPSGESELSIAEEEIVEALLAQPLRKKRRTVAKGVAKPAAKTKSGGRPTIARRSRASAAKKNKSRKLPNRK